jgi:hypothetical protein
VQRQANYEANVNTQARHRKADQKKTEKHKKCMNKRK